MVDFWSADLEIIELEHSTITTKHLISSVVLLVCTIKVFKITGYGSGLSWGKVFEKCLRVTCIVAAYCK